MIYNQSSPVYLFIMNNRKMSTCFQAWTYFYANILQFDVLRSAFVAGKLIFDEKTSFRVEGEPHWNVLQIPDWFAMEKPDDIALFWGYVKHFCRVCLCNDVFYVIKGGPSTDGGVGLCVRKATDNLALSHELFGLIEKLDAVDLSAMQNNFKYKSFILVDVNSTAVLYGPVSLINNDNHSAFVLLERDFVSDVPLFIGLPTEQVVEWYHSPVTSLTHVRGARIVATETCYLEAGDQIHIWYKDSNFVDFTRESSEDEQEKMEDEPVQSIVQVPRQRKVVRRRSQSQSPVLIKEETSNTTSSSTSCNTSSASSSTDSTSSHSATATAVKVKPEPISLSPIAKVEDFALLATFSSAFGSKKKYNVTTKYAPTGGYKKVTVNLLGDDSGAESGMKRLRLIDNKTSNSSTAGHTPRKAAKIGSAAATCAAAPSPDLLLPNTSRTTTSTKSYVADTHDDETQLEYTPESNSHSSSSAAAAHSTRPIKGRRRPSAAADAQDDNSEAFFASYTNDLNSGDDAKDSDFEP